MISIENIYSEKKFNKKKTDSNQSKSLVSTNNKIVISDSDSRNSKLIRHKFFWLSVFQFQHFHFKNMN